MKEYIEKGALLESMEHFAPEDMTPLLRMLVTKQPAADVVEVVRCKDCVWYMPLGDQYTYKGNQAMHCFCHCRLVKEDGYCGDGVLKPSAPKSKTKIVGKFTAERSAE